MKSLWVFLFLSAPAIAETSLPALHDVAGVAANDVLNIRAEPNAGSAIIGSLGPTLDDVEIVGLSADGKWGRVNAGEGAGWAYMSYLAAQDRPAWFALQSGLSCGGTEPFWSLQIDASGQTATFTTPEQAGQPQPLTALWPGDEWRKTAAVQIGTGAQSGFATFRAEACSDGMSDRAFGIRADVFLPANPATSAVALQGCCSLLP